VDLDEVTRTVGQKYFRQPVALSRGITLGLKYFLEAKCAVMIASGEKKAGVIRQAVEEAISPGMPASIIRKHVNGYIMLDEAAASALTMDRKNYPA
jgi:6-phosphogluconolactonase/glucosamine-6-phosphate isomerase/deaminase